MDDVFGNSSAETVVCAQGFGKDSENDTSPSGSSSENAEDSPEEVDSGEVQDENVGAAYVSVIQNSTSCSAKSTDSDGFKVPYSHYSKFSNQRYTQAALVTTLPSKDNLYQNVPLKPNYTPVYINLPWPNLASNNFKPKVNGAYIQLWTGVRQKRNLSESDSDDTVDGRMSETGYVKMSSPYIRSPASSVVSDFAHQLASKSGTEEDMFCPFCPRPFRLEREFCDHIQTIHRQELQKVIRGNKTVLVQHCPLCHGRFLNLRLLPSHLLEFHRDSLINLLLKYNRLSVDSSFVKCPFCMKKVPLSKVGEDVLLYHFLQLHNVDYENLIHSLFKAVSSSIKGEGRDRVSIEDIAQVIQFRSSTTPELSIKFQNLTCDLDTNLDNSSLGTLNDTWSSHYVDTENVDYQEALQGQKNKGILRSEIDLSRRPSVRRELRFSVPPVTSQEIYVPESPESSSPSSEVPSSRQDSEEVNDEDTASVYDYFQTHNIPVRVDSLCSADFIELTHQTSRKRRKLSIGLKTRKSFRKKDKENKENINLVENVLDGLKSVGRGKSNQHPKIVVTSATRTFTKPKTLLTSMVPNVPASIVGSAQDSRAASGCSTSGTSKVSEARKINNFCPFSNVKLYSPLRMFRCNRCLIKFCDNESLGIHVRYRHRGILGFLRPHFGCGICEAKFYENKHLVKHCLQHHTSLLEIRSPTNNKIAIYRLNQNS